MGLHYFNFFLYFHYYIVKLTFGEVCVYTSVNFNTCIDLNTTTIRIHELFIYKKKKKQYFFFKYSFQRLSSL